MHQQPPRPYRIAVKDVSVLIGADMHAADKQLAVLHGAEGILQIDLTGPDGFDLRARKLDPGLEAIQHKVFMKSLAVIGNLLYALLLRRHAVHILSHAG